MNKFVITTTNDPSVNLAIEEKLFKDTSTDVAIYLWQNQNTIVIGNNQSSFLECNIPSCKKDKVKIVRRMSGGGAVFHDLGNLNFTFIFNTSQHKIEEFLELVIQSLASLGISNIKSERNDLLINGQKFSGHAYYRDGDRFLFHGTLLINSDLNRLSKYLRPSVTKLKNKGIDSVRKRVVNLSEIAEVTVDMVKERIRLKTLEIFPNIESVTMDQRCCENLIGKYDDLKLLESQNPDSSLRMDIKTKLGNFSLLIATKENRITKLEIYSDALKKPNYNDFIDSHVGKIFDEVSLRKDFVANFD